MTKTQVRKRFNWKALRITSQVVAFTLVTLYFLGLVYPLDVPWRPDMLFQLNPLTHLYLLLSGHGVVSILWALIALVLLFVVARIFCGWFCPLGALLDLVSGIRGRLKLLNGGRLGPTEKLDESGEPVHARRPRQRPFLPRNFSIYLLIALLVPALFGNPLIWILDPIVFTFKFLTVALKPVLDIPLGAAYLRLDNIFYQADWWYPLQNGYNTYIASEHVPSYTDTALFLLFALAIFSLEFFQRRFWCRYICPLGAMLRIAFRFHPLRRRITPQCTHCLKCEAACHFGGTTEHDCIYCMECITSCKDNSITFLPTATAINSPAKITDRPAAGASTPKACYRLKIDGELPRARISRRLMLEYAAGGLLAVPALQMLDNRIELPADFIRPPGVGDDEQRFNELCIKCGQCLKVCLTNVLQPALTEAGLSALWTPRLIFRQGTCEFECNLCGQVCPSGAIPNLALKVKQQTKIGIAWIDKMRCIPYIAGHDCVVCEEHCPTSDKAIKMRPRNVTGEDGITRVIHRPYVEEQLCIGCGICEYVCPIVGLAAVRVYRKPPGVAFGDKPEFPDGDGGYGASGGYGEYPEG